MDKIKYNLGLDLGIASVGWGIVGIDDDKNPTHIIDTGVVIVESMETGTEGKLKTAKRRSARGTRRTLRRRKHRISRIKNLLRQEFNILDYKEVYNSTKLNVYELKVKGLEEKLTKEELAIVLIHYSKHRGFKSNRKSETAEGEGPILKAIAQNKEILGDESISKYYLDNLNGIDKLKNDGEYKFSFGREEYKNEIEKLLDIQIQNNLIDKIFKKKYIKIWESQRDFSEGPGGESEYSVDFEKVFGRCTFEKDELRAPRQSLSQQTHVGLIKLSNLRYKDLSSDNKEYQSLSIEQVRNLLEESYKTKDFTYQKIKNKLWKNKKIKFKNLKLSKRIYDSFK